MSKKNRLKDRFKARFQRGPAEIKGHPTYIFAKDGDNFKYIGITHSDITDGVTNIELEKNPNPNDKKDAFIRPKAEKAHESKFGRKYHGWAFDEKDKGKVKSVIKKDREKDLKDKNENADDKK
jgi:hypothetical protein